MSSLGNLGNLWKKLQSLQRSGPSGTPPIPLPIPTGPLPIGPPTLPGQAGQFQLALMQQQAQQDFRQQVANITAQNQEMMANWRAQQTNFTRQQQTAQGAMTGFGIGQARSGFGSLGQVPPTIGSVGGGLSNILGGVGVAAGAMTGNPALGAAAGALGTFAAVVFESVDRLRNWSRALIDSNIQLGEFSGAMQVNKAKQMILDVRRSMRMGDALADTTKQQIDSNERVRRAFEGDEIYLRKVMGATSSQLGETAADVREGKFLGAAARLSPGLGALLSNPVGSVQALGNASSWLMDKALQQLGRPFRHREP